ncbi:hypothetical protein FIBSPDRAFT_888645 [Athelia psychrophila]|uniref:Uncharacterized protein n=1 Tax=Athelia psychrophila TaxID=1759441 RepID=A0A166NDE4_9AGAM|nr:hypothetical protein FIBSPDRAFT_888645 [Fibularhizoctonia sp. CBS 109695]
MPADYECTVPAECEIMGVAWFPRIRIRNSFLDWVPIATVSEQIWAFRWWQHMLNLEMGDTGTIWESSGSIFQGEIRSGHQSQFERTDKAGYQPILENSSGFFEIEQTACPGECGPRDESNKEGEDTGAWEHMVRGADLGEQMNPLQDHDPEYEKISAENARHWKHSQKEKELGPSALPARMKHDEKVVASDDDTSKKASASGSSKVNIRPKPTPLTAFVGGGANEPL